MLEIRACANAAGVKAYFTGTREALDYYIEGRDNVLAWGGKLAQRWGLSGEAKRDDFFALVDGYDPVTGESLVGRRDPNRRPAYEVVISAPKPVSLLYEATGDQRILDAFVRSSDRVLAMMEQSAAARVRAGGADHDEITGNWAYAATVHFESRPSKEDMLPDPQLHRHHIIMNLTDTPDGMRALQMGIVKGDGHYWEAVFHNMLAGEMRQLGYGVEREGKFWTVAGVPRELVEKFSRRTMTIEETAKELGIKNPKAKAKLGGTTRLGKQKDLSHDELRAYWLARMKPEERAALLSARGGGQHVTERAAMAYAVAHHFERASVVPEKRLYETALRYGVGSVSLEGLRKEAGRLGVILQDGQATTQEVLEEEGRMIRFAREGKGAMRPVDGSRNQSFRSSLEQSSHSTLNAGQQAALSALLASRDKVTVLDAAAGTGKTTMLKEYAGHVNAVWLGTTSTAVKELEAAGLPAMTVARFLLDKRAQAGAKRIVVDEASMLGHKDAATLFGIAEDAGARLDLVGDSRQHKAVPRGNLLNLMDKQVGLRPIRLDRIVRQKGDYKAAVELLAAGRVRDGFRRLDKLGNVQVGGHAELVAEYMRAVKEGKTALIVSPTHAEGDKLAALVREALAREGKLHGPEREIERLVPLNLTQAEAGAYRPGPGELLLAVGKSRAAYRRGALAVRAGEKLRVTAGGAAAGGKRLRTGDMLTVEGFSEAGELVTDRGVIPKSFQHFAYAYVATSYASQGQTVDRVMIDMGSRNFPAVNREAAYVAASRGRERAVVFTDDKKALLEAIERSDPRKSAHELLGHRARRYRRRFAYLQRLWERSREAIWDIVRQPTRELTNER